MLVSVLVLFGGPASVPSPPLSGPLSASPPALSATSAPCVTRTLGGVPEGTPPGSGGSLAGHTLSPAHVAAPAHVSRVGVPSLPGGLGVTLDGRPVMLAPDTLPERLSVRGLTGVPATSAMISRHWGRSASVSPRRHRYLGGREEEEGGAGAEVEEKEEEEEAGGTGAAGAGASTANSSSELEDEEGEEEEVAERERGARSLPSPDPTPRGTATTPPLSAPIVPTPTDERARPCPDPSPPDGPDRDV